MNRGKNRIQKPGENEKRILVFARKIKEYGNEACIVVLVITKGKPAVFSNHQSILHSSKKILSCKKI